MSLKDNIELLSVRKSCTGKDVQTYSFHIEMNKEVFPLYISNVELFISLAIAAIVLSVTYREKVLGHEGPLNVGAALIAAWFFLLAAIGMGAYYLFAAIKHMEARYNCSGYLTFGYAPGDIYVTVVLLFVLGLLSLFIAVIVQSKRTRTRISEPRKSV